MKLLLPIGAAVAALAVSASAQDTTVKSRTEVKADDAKVLTMTGCLRQDVTGAYKLTGGVIAHPTRYKAGGPGPPHWPGCEAPCGAPRTPRRGWLPRPAGSCR